jgi:hypothetical protein
VVVPEVGPEVVPEFDPDVSPVPPLVSEVVGEPGWFVPYVGRLGGLT